MHGPQWSCKKSHNTSMLEVCGNWFFVPIPSHFSDFSPIPIPFPFPWLIVFPFPWESHGIPVFPIPMHTSNVYCQSTVTSLFDCVNSEMDSMDCELCNSSRSYHPPHPIMHQVFYVAMFIVLTLHRLCVSFNTVKVGSCDLKLWKKWQIHLCNSEMVQDRHVVTMDDWYDVWDMCCMKVWDFWWSWMTLKIICSFEPFDTFLNPVALKNSLAKRGYQNGSSL